MEEKKGKREGKVNSSVNQNLKLLGEPPMKLIEINPKNVPKKRANIKTKKEVSNDADEAFDDQNSCSEVYLYNIYIVFAIMRVKNEALSLVFNVLGLH